MEIKIYKRIIKKLYYKTKIIYNKINNLRNKYKINQNK